MFVRGWLIGVLAVAACGRLQFEDRSTVADGAAGDGGADDGAAADVATDNNTSTGIVRRQKEPATLIPVECLAATCSAVFPGPTTAAGLIVALVTINDTAVRTITSVSDDHGGSYTRAVARPISDTGDEGLAAIYYRENSPAGSPFTVTVATDQMTYIDLVVVEYGGLPTSGALTTTSSNACGVCPGVDGGSLGDGGLSVGVFTTANTDVQSITMGVGWNGLAAEVTPANAVMGAEDRIGSANSVASWMTGFMVPKVAVSAKFGL